MTGEYGDKWLDWAIRIEEQAGCDIEAGLELGQHLGDYLVKSQNYINREKLMLLLREELGEILSPTELEEMANAIQDIARDPIIEKLQNSKVA